MMTFTHRFGGPLKMPKHKGIKHCMMKMGEETIEGVGKMFKVWSDPSFALQCINY